MGKSCKTCLNDKCGNFNLKFTTTRDCCPECRELLLPCPVSPNETISKTLIILGIIFILTLSLAGTRYFFPEWFEFYPSLKPILPVLPESPSESPKIGEIQKQIDNLRGNVTELQNLVNQYNGEIFKTIAELNKKTGEDNIQITELKKVVADLQAKLDEQGKTVLVRIEEELKKLPKEADLTEIKQMVKSLEAKNIELEHTIYDMIQRSPNAEIKTMLEEVLRQIAKPPPVVIYLYEKFPGTEPPEHVKINQLLEQCVNHFDTDCSTTKKCDAATKCYRQVLELDSANALAKIGLQKIEKEYIKWIKGAIRSRQPKEASRLLEQLRSINPSSSSLPRLSSDLTRLKEEKPQPRYEKSPTIGQTTPKKIIVGPDKEKSPKEDSKGKPNSHQEKVTQLTDKNLSTSKQKKITAGPDKEKSPKEDSKGKPKEQVSQQIVKSLPAVPGEESTTPKQPGGKTYPNSEISEGTGKGTPSKWR